MVENNDTTCVLQEEEFLQILACISCLFAGLLLTKEPILHAPNYIPRVVPLYQKNIE